jgi:small subunit ribosomal protein S13
MSLFLDLSLKKNRRLIYVLKDVYGIGLLRSRTICVDLGFNFNIKFNDLDQKIINKINSLIALRYRFLIQAELKKKIYVSIGFMRRVRTYRGVRHTYRLPVNGQRTRNNAKTKRWLK